MQENVKTRLPVHFQKIGGVLFLALLAACGLAGAKGAKVQTVSVPVERSALTGESAAKMSTAERLARDRQEEIALLDSVLESGDADQATRQSALAQKTQLTGRMELEAQARACLSGMGYEDAQVVCGAQMLTVLMPGTVAAAGDGARIIAAVSEQTGTGPENVRILFAN